MNEETLFEHARQLTGRERVAFLDRECQDPALRVRVELLLAAHASPQLPLDGLGQSTRTFGDPAATGSFRPAPSAEEAEGVVIAGRYKLRQQIGEGGMGTVWMADQTEPVKRKVAVKLIRVERGQSKTILARFEAERQAIALMDHPHIAKLLDAGTTETGSPFFVMELVKGVPLNDYCDQHRLTIAERLNLFTQICSAVQHAHQKGIIHRDLKPSNILVESHDGKPVPKVIDFGLAKATTGLQLTDQSMFTAFGSVMGTPLYMAPEQATFNAVDVDTRADVYALGVILYELLTGTTPLTKETIKKAALDEMLRMIREQEAPTPSSRLSSAESTPSVAASRQMEPLKLGRFVKGELDWIVLKALSKDRDRRYETANGFAKDIERFLNHEPVTAGPPSARYRFQKFVQRNRGQVIAANLVLCALLAGVIGTTLGLVEAKKQEAEARKQEGIALKEAGKKEQARAEEARQRGIAEANERKAEAAADEAIRVLDVMVSDITGESLATQKVISDEQKKLLIEVLPLYQRFLGQKAVEEQPRVRMARAAIRVGSIEYHLGRKEKAAAAIRQSRDGFEKLVIDFPTVPEYRNFLSGSHHNLGTILHGLGEWDEAAVEYRKALILLEKLVADFPSVPVYRSDLSESHRHLGSMLNGLGKWREAEVECRKALSIQEKLVADFPADPNYRMVLARCQNNMGRLLVDLGKRVEAEVEFRKAIVLREKLASNNPTVPDCRNELAMSRNSLGHLLNDQGKQEAAEAEYRKAIVLWEKLAADFPAVPEYRVSLGGSYCNIGILVRDSGKPADCLPWFKKAIATLSPVHEAEPYDVTAKQFLWNSVAGRVISYQLLQRYTDALADCELVIQLSPPKGLAWSHFNHGKVLDAVGERTKAEAAFDRSLALREAAAKVGNADDKDAHWQLAQCLIDRGLIYLRSRRPEESIVWMDRAEEAYTRIGKRWPGPEVTSQLRWCHQNRAIALDRLGRRTDAIKEWDQALERCPKEDQNVVRAKRATSRVLGGMVVEAVADISELSKLPNWTAGQLYDFACVYAMAAGKLADKKQEYTDAAMGMLSKAVRGGFKNHAHIKTDTDLDSLRDRDDFKKLIAELEAKFPPMKDSKK